MVKSLVITVLSRSIFDEVMKLGDFFLLRNTHRESKIHTLLSIALPNTEWFKTFLH